MKIRLPIVVVIGLAASFPRAASSDTLLHCRHHNGEDGGIIRIDQYNHDFSFNDPTGHYSGKGKATFDGDAITGRISANGQKIEIEISREVGSTIVWRVTNRGSQVLMLLMCDRTGRF
jgi:hypothetical protein